MSPFLSLNETTSLIKVDNKCCCFVVCLHQLISSAGYNSADTLMSAHLWYVLILLFLKNSFTCWYPSFSWIVFIHFKQWHLLVLASQLVVFWVIFANKLNIAGFQLNKIKHLRISPYHVFKCYTFVYLSHNLLTDLWEEIRLLFESICESALDCLSK